MKSKEIFEGIKDSIESASKLYHTKTDLSKEQSLVLKKSRRSYESLILTICDLINSDTID